MAKYPKGSEWRIWDLHIHTPGTSKNAQYGNDNAAWNAYIDKLEENTNVVIFGQKTPSKGRVLLMVSGKISTFKLS